MTKAMSTPAIRSAVLLAAGSGSRMRELTADRHKALLPIAGTAALKRILDTLCAAGIPDIVLVLGHRAEELRAHVARWHGERVRCVTNDRYGEEVNILSTDIGVDALPHPEAGYLIAETDVVAARPAGGKSFPRTPPAPFG
jgi:CTP:molybdopterin cytidylyltransferase MocA